MKKRLLIMITLLVAIVTGAGAQAYSGDLGVNYSPESTTLKLYAPSATSVIVKLYASATATTEKESRSMDKLMDGSDWTGVWTFEFNGNYKNYYYAYNVDGNDYVDPYSVAYASSTKRSFIADIYDVQPSGWDADYHRFSDMSNETIITDISTPFMAPPASSTTPDDGKAAMTEMMQQVLNAHNANKQFHVRIDFSTLDIDASIQQKYVIDACEYWVNTYHVDGIVIATDIDASIKAALRAALDNIDSRIALEHTHTPGEAVRENEVAATCTEDGSYEEVVYCIECGAELSREAKTIPALGHDMVFADEVPATITSTGLYAHWECTRCGKWFADYTGSIEVGVGDLVIPKLPAPGIAIDEEHFPDEGFRSYITIFFDKDGDGYLNDAEIADIKTLYIDEQNISDLTGIEYFTELLFLDCSFNQLTQLDVSQNTLLKELYCDDNKLTALDLSNNTALKWLSCEGNNLTTLDVSNNTALEGLSCEGNNLTTLDVSKNTELQWLSCGYNQLTALDLSQNAKLADLSCVHNQLAQLTVAANGDLQFDINSYWNLLKGDAVDALIASLPQVSNKRWYFYNPHDTDQSNVAAPRRAPRRANATQEEGNEMTTAQVAAAKSKGWTPYYFTGTSWQAYEGVDTAITATTADGTSSAAPRYNLQGQRVGADYKGIVIENGHKVVKR